MRPRFLCVGRRCVAHALDSRHGRDGFLHPLQSVERRRRKLSRSLGHLSDRCGDVVSRERQDRRLRAGQRFHRGTSRYRLRYPRQCPRWPIRSYHGWKPSREQQSGRRRQYAADVQGGRDLQSGPNLPAGKQLLDHLMGHGPRHARLLGGQPRWAGHDRTAFRGHGRHLRRASHLQHRPLLFPARCLRQVERNR